MIREFLQGFLEGARDFFGDLWFGFKQSTEVGAEAIGYALGVVFWIVVMLGLVLGVAYVAHLVRAFF